MLELGFRLMGYCSGGHPKCYKILVHHRGCSCVLWKYFSLIWSQAKRNLKVQACRGRRKIPHHWSFGIINHWTPKKREWCNLGYSSPLWNLNIAFGYSQETLFSLWLEHVTEIHRMKVWVLIGIHYLENLLFWARISTSS